jgi:hypothetical protein
MARINEALLSPTSGLARVFLAALRFAAGGAKAAKPSILLMWTIKWSIFLAEQQRQLHAHIRYRRQRTTDRIGAPR